MAVNEAEASLLAAIDRALNVDFVEWRHVGLFVASLELQQNAIDRLAIHAPGSAIRAYVHFIGAIGRVFDRVHDECELAMFCTLLAEGAVELATQYPEGLMPVARGLLAAYHADEYGRFDDVPDVLSKAMVDKSSRQALADLLEADASRLDQFAGAKLRAAADRLRFRRNPRRKATTSPQRLKAGEER